MTKYTCWKDYDHKVEGAIEGTKEKVHAWIQERLMASSVGGSGTAFLEKMGKHQFGKALIFVI
jgi:hypothetical protein